MNNVEFEEERSTTTYEKEPDFLPALVIRFSRGKVENEKQANVVLVIIAGIIFLISMYIAFFGGAKTNQFPDSAVNTNYGKNV